MTQGIFIEDVLFDAYNPKTKIPLKARAELEKGAAEWEWASTAKSNDEAQIVLASAGDVPAQEISHLQEQWQSQHQGNLARRCHLEWRMGSEWL